MCAVKNFIELRHGLLNLNPIIALKNVGTINRKNSVIGSHVINVRKNSHGIHRNLKIGISVPTSVLPYGERKILKII